MLDREAQEALVKLMETKRNLEEQVLKSMRNPDLSTGQLRTLHRKYIVFLEKLQEVEDELEAHEKGTPEEWIAMWKGQTND